MGVEIERLQRLPILRRSAWETIRLVPKLISARTR